MSTIPQFLKLIDAKGSPARYRRNSDVQILCPCVTPEGFRNPLWHLQWKTPFGINATGNIGGALITSGTSVAYRVYALAEDGGSGAAVGPPSEATSLVAGTYNFVLTFTPTISKWGYFLVARSIDGGPWLEVARLSSGAPWLDNVAQGGEGPVVPEYRTCNEQAMIEIAPKDYTVKAFIQPIQSTRATRLNDEIIQTMFGEIQTDDHLGIFPYNWKGHTLDFYEWSQSGDEFVEYDGRFFLVVNANKIPDPDDGNPSHHWEVGLRLIDIQPHLTQLTTPVITGTPALGQILTATMGTWDGDPVPTLIIQWYSADSLNGPWTAIPGETGTTHLISFVDVGKFFRARVTADNGVISTSALTNTTLTAVQPTVPEMPVISRGLPIYGSTAGGFGGAFAEANAVDDDYASYWRSVVSPNGGTAQWLTIDMNGISAARKTNVWFVMKNPSRPSFQPAPAVLGSTSNSTFSSLPRNFKLQGHTSVAQPSVNDAGWVDLHTETDNRRADFIKTGLNLSTYNWFRVYVTAASGVTGATDDVQFLFDLRDVSNGATDSIIVYGDSISMEAFRGRRPDNAAWTLGPIENILQAMTGRVAPVFQDASTGGWTTLTADANKVAYVGGLPGHYVLLNFGSNDANFANVDMNLDGGLTSPYGIQFKANLQSLITYFNGLGKKVIIPHIPYGDLSTWSAPNVLLLNQLIDQVIAANPGVAMAGPDLYSFFQAHQNTLRDHLHPTWDSGVPAGLFNGLTGYENLLALWRDNIIARLYSS